MQRGPKNVVLFAELGYDNEINNNRRTGHVARTGEMRTTHINTVKNPDGMK
jgi:hypothetical protein